MTYTVHRIPPLMHAAIEQYPTQSGGLNQVAGARDFLSCAIKGDCCHGVILLPETAIR